MQGLLILVALAYLLLAPIGLIVAVVAFLKGRRFEARLEALEADATRLAARVRDVATSGTVGEAAVEPVQPGKVEQEPGPAIVPQAVARMQMPRPPSAHTPPPESAEELPIDGQQHDAAAEPPPPPKPEPPSPPVEPPVAAIDVPPLEPEAPVPDVTAESILEVARSSLPPAAPTKAKPPKPPFDWENLVGVKLFSWIAGIALVIAAVSFLRYSIDHGWLSPPVRMAIGLLAGVALLVVCELKAARRYPVTANALDGAGVAVLFATFFSAHVLWQLMPVVPTFMAMALVAATAVVLAIRRDSLFIALLGLVGGFATPFMLSSALDRPLSLFGYLVILNAGLAWVAYRRGWPVLTALSLAFTTIHQWVWVVRFLDTSNIGVALAVFLVFPVLAVAGLVLARSRDTAHDHRFQQTAVVAAVLPLLFAAYMAVVPEFGARYGLLFSFLFLVVAGLAAVAIWRGPERLHLVGAVSTVVVFALWMAQFLFRRVARHPGVSDALHRCSFCSSRWLRTVSAGRWSSPSSSRCWPRRRCCLSFRR